MPADALERHHKACWRACERVHGISDALDNIIIAAYLGPLRFGFLGDGLATSADAQHYFSSYNTSPQTLPVREADTERTTHLHCGGDRVLPGPSVRKSDAYDA